VPPTDLELQYREKLEKYLQRLIDAGMLSYEDALTQQELALQQLETQGLTPDLPYYGVTIGPIIEKQRQEAELGKREAFFAKQRTGAEVMPQKKSLIDEINRMRRIMGLGELTGENLKQALRMTPRELTDTIYGMAGEIGAQVLEANRRLAEQARGQQRPYMSPNLLRLIQRARSLGIDTSQAEAMLTQPVGITGSDLAAQAAATLLYQIIDAERARAAGESRQLAIEWPERFRQFREQYTAYQRTLPATGYMRPPEEAFGSWLRRQPWYEQEQIKRETERYKEFPRLYPAYLEYRETAGFPALTFPKWIEKTPIAKAYYETKLERRMERRMEPRAVRTPRFRPALQRA
jgi:hypothetical protein